MGLQKSWVSQIRGTQHKADRRKELLQSMRRLHFSRIPLLQAMLQSMLSLVCHHAQLLLEKIVALLVWMAQDFQSDFKTDEIHSAAHEVLKSQI